MAQTKSKRSRLTKNLPLSGSGQLGRKKGTGVVVPDQGEIPHREAMLLENRFIKGMTLADSAIAAGYNVTSDSSAKTHASNVIKKHTDANSELIKSIKAKMITVDRIAGIIDDGLNAQVAIKTGSNFAMVPDHNTRHKFLETTLDIMGGRAPKKIEVEHKSFEQRLIEITVNGTQERLENGRLPPLIIDGELISDDSDY